VSYLKNRAILDFYEIRTRTFKGYCFICLSSGGTIAVHDEPSGFDARCQARSGEPHVVFSRT